MSVDEEYYQYVFDFVVLTTCKKCYAKCVLTSLQSFHFEIFLFDSEAV